MQKREAIGLSQAGLAAEAEVSAPYLSRLERGEYTNPSPVLLMRIAQRLDIPLADLYAITGCLLPSELPGYEAYLHAMHPDWPADSVQELVDFYTFLKQRNSLK